MATAFQQSAFQWTPNKAFQIDVTVAVVSGGGGLDPGEGLKRRYPPVKPTGLLHLPKRGKQAPRVEERIERAATDRAEIAERLAREFGEETRLIPEFRPISTMTMAEVEAEIGTLLRKRLRTEEDDILLLMLMAAASV